MDQSGQDLIDLKFTDENFLNRFDSHIQIVLMVRSVRLPIYQEKSKDFIRMHVAVQKREVIRFFNEDENKYVIPAELVFNMCNMTQVGEAILKNYTTTNFWVNTLPATTANVEFQLNFRQKVNGEPAYSNTGMTELVFLEHKALYSRKPYYVMENLASDVLRGNYLDIIKGAVVGAFNYNGNLNDLVGKK